MEKEYETTHFNQTNLTANGHQNLNNVDELTSTVKKTREFKTFTNIKSVEERLSLIIKSFNLVDDKGNSYSSKDAKDIIASYQVSKAKQNADSLCKRVRNFLQDPNFDVYVRYVQSDKSAKEYASEWMTRTLTHALFPIPERFTFNKVLFSVVPVNKEYEFNVIRTHGLMTGNHYIKVADLTEDNSAIVPITSTKTRVFVPRDVFIDTCNSVISELQLNINEDGEISALGHTLMKWIVKSTSIIDSESTDISDVNLF